MEKLYFIASIIVFLTLTACRGENLFDPDGQHSENEHGQPTITEELTLVAGKSPTILDRIKGFSERLTTHNMKDLFSKEEKNYADHISVNKTIKPELEDLQQTRDEKHRSSESSGVIGHVGVRGVKGISPPEANDGDLSRVPRQSPSNSAAYQERLQQQMRDNPEQAQKIKEMQADAQARYTQALDSERAKNIQGQMASRKQEFLDSEEGQKMREKVKEGGGMKKAKERMGKRKGKGKGRKKGSKKGSGGGKKKGKGERKNKLKSGKKKGKGGRKGKGGLEGTEEGEGKGDREGKRKKDKGTTGSGLRERTRGNGATKGQAPSLESM